MSLREELDSQTSGPYLAAGGMGDTEDDSYDDDEEEDEPSDNEPEANVFFEETDPDFEDTLGAFKTPNPQHNRWQRRLIHLASERSRFRKTVESVLVVHGWKTPEKKEAMSLIVLSVKLNCHAINFRIQSARMWFAFYEDTKTSPPNPEAAAPEVVAFAPFVEQDVTNVTTERRKVNTTLGGNISVNQIVSGGLKGSRAVASSYTRDHFDRGTADYLAKDDRVYGVNWYCEQNDLTRYGVKPHFHLAVLLKRNHTKADNKPISFSGVFDMRIVAGFIHDFDDGIRRAFHLGKPEDEAIYYDPSLEAQTGGQEGFGQKILDNVKSDNLGNLMGKGGLARLLDPEGIVPGLEPMAPS